MNAKQASKSVMRTSTRLCYEEDCHFWIYERHTSGRSAGVLATACLEEEMCVITGSPMRRKGGVSFQGEFGDKQTYAAWDDGEVRKSWEAG